MLFGTTLTDRILTLKYVEICDLAGISDSCIKGNSNIQCFCQNSTGLHVVVIPGDQIWFILKYLLKKRDAVLLSARK